MRPDLTYKTIFGHAFTVEELMHWLVADMHGAGELVDALDFSGLERAHEQSVTTGGDGQHGYANDIVWRAPFHGPPEDDGGEGWLCVSSWRLLVGVAGGYVAGSRGMALTIFRIGGRPLRG